MQRNSYSLTLFREILVLVRHQSIRERPRSIAVYDGDCPFCSNMVLHKSLQSRLSGIMYLNARSNPSVYSTLLWHGIDLDKSMVYISEHHVLIGAEALAFLLHSARDKSILHFVVYKLLKMPFMSRMVYCLLSYGRLITLFLLGRRSFKSNN